MDIGLYRYVKALKEEAYNKYVPTAKWVTSSVRRDYQRQVMNFVAEKLYYAIPYWHRGRISEEHEILREVFEVSEATIIRTLNMRKYYNLQAKWHDWKSELYARGTMHKIRNAEWYSEQEGILMLNELNQVTISDGSVEWSAERFECKAKLFGGFATIISSSDFERTFKIAQDGGLNLWNKYELIGEYYE